MVDVLGVNLGCMEVTVIYRVQPTVRTVRVTHIMEHVLHVNLDGLGYTVKQVILFNIYAIKIRIPGFLVYFCCQ